MQHLVQLLCMLWLAGCSSSHGTADGDGSQDQNAGSDAGNAGPRDMPQPVEVVDGDQDAGQPSCFAEGTPIATPDGDRAIELLQVGDLVWAFDHDLDRRVARPVIAVHHHASAVVGRLVTGAGHALHVTASHPIFAPRQGRYIDAEELSRGVPLLAAGEFGKFSRIASEGFEPNVERVPVHNLSVDSPHNYFAAGLLVHNKPPVE